MLDWTMMAKLNLGNDSTRIDKENSLVVVVVDRDNFLNCCYRIIVVEKKNSMNYHENFDDRNPMGLSNSTLEKKNKTFRNKNNKKHTEND